MERANIIASFLASGSGPGRAVAESPVLLTVLPNRRIRVAQGDLSPDQTLLLENFADCDERREWSLSAAKALKSVEQGAAIAQFRSFLAACDPQPLPETVEGFLADIERRGNSCIFKAKALLLECLSSEVADLIAANPQTAKLCQRTRSRGLVVLEKNEETFRDALDAIGYGLPRV